MKKSAIIVLFAILILILALIMWQNFEENKDYKGELGEASPRPQNLSVYVLPAIPILTIISPENITYSTSTILLNYSVINEVESIWYNLDNGINTTINSPAYFNAAEGSHVLYLYANNSQGASSKSVIFSVKIETSQPPGGGDSGGGSGGGGGGSTGNITEQQKENITTPQESQKNITEQETPKNATPISKTPRTISKITKTFLISLFLLILLIILIIFLIAIIKRKKDKRTRKQKKK